jgi:hypothetical protein
MNKDNHDDEEEYGVPSEAGCLYRVVLNPANSKVVTRDDA